MNHRNDAYRGAPQMGDGSTKPRPVSRLALPVLRAMARVDLALEHNVSWARRVLEGLLPSVLTDVELSRLCATLYEQRGGPVRQDRWSGSRSGLRRSSPSLFGSSLSPKSNVIREAP